MPYGVKHGVRMPGDWRIVDILGLGGSGAAGILAALVTDYTQQGEQSALYTINQWVVGLSELLGLISVPLWIIIIGLTVLGASSILYFQPITRQGAFAHGFGLLAVMMTATPPDRAGGIEAVDHGFTAFGAPAATQASLASGIMPASFVSGGAFVLAASGSYADQYDVHLTVNFPEGLPDDFETLVRKGEIRGRMHNEDTGQSWNLFKTSGGTVDRDGDTLIFHAGVPAKSETAQIWVRIECPSYAIEEQSATAEIGEELDWTIEMQPSSTPLFLQRLAKSYWF